MKTKKQSQRWLPSLAVCLALAGSISTSLAQNTNPTNSFDTEASITSLVKWWGVGVTYSWDGTLDAAGDSASGSVRFEVPYTEADGEQFMTHYTIANRWGWDNGYVLDATTYTNLSFDVKVDPASFPISSGANYGNLQVGLTTKTSWDNRISTPNFTIPLTATNWTHVNIPVDPTWNFLNEVVGFYIYMWSGASHTNNLIFNLDNVMLTKPTAPVVIPPPTMSLERAKSKLNLIASTDVQYERRSIRSVDTALSWVDAAAPVTYSLTIKSSPGTSAPYYQAHVFLAPSEPNDDAPSVDWNIANLVWFHIENLANGGAQATFRYKTNLPGGNNMLFNTDPAATNSTGALMGVGNLGTIQSTKILGEWKLTMSDLTNATMTAPDGTTATVSMPTDAALLFSGGMRVYYGIQANNADQYGKGYVFDSVKVSTPTTTLLEDDFSGDTLNLDKWQKRAGDANNSIFVVPSNAPWWVKWTMPATGFNPQTSANLGSTSSWKALTSTNLYLVRGTRMTLAMADELSPTGSFFRLMKRSFAKLQILLPGETAAPGTSTGKTGKPTDVQPATPFDIVVNAVDNEWYPITGITDTIHLTTTDEGGFMAADAALVNGTVTLTGSYLGNEGTWTITASDVTDPTKGSDTSAPIKVVP